MSVATPESSGLPLLAPDPLPNQPAPGRWVLSSLAAVVTIWAAILGSVTASAATGSGAENRVPASTQEFTVVVGASDRIPAGQQLGNNPAHPEIVVATGVAAKSESYVYRGVSRKSPAYGDALEGNAVPRNVNGATTAEAHNYGNPSDLADSPFTSWSRDPAIARIHAGEGGIILRLPTGKPPAGSTWKFEWSPTPGSSRRSTWEPPQSGQQVLRC